MANEVDELFSEGGQTIEPRVGRVFVLAAIGLFVALAGLPWSTVPGGIIVLIALYFAENEYARLQAGFFANDLAPTIRGARAAALGAVVAVALLLVLQLVLGAYGFYDMTWSYTVIALGELLWGPLEG